MGEIIAAAWKERITEKAKKTKTPIFGQYELTPRCNLDCKMCYIHNLNSNALKERELSTSTWKRIFDEAYEMGLMYATLTGGECLLRQDFKELYLHLWNKRVKVKVFTNGVLINEEYIAFFKQYPPEKVQISLYGSDEEGYLKVTGHRGFEKTITAIEKLMEAGINVVAAVTPSSFIKEDYINIMRLCREKGIQHFSGEFLLAQNRDDPDKNDHYLTEEEILELAKARSVLSKPLTPCECTPEPGGKATEAPQGLTCSAGSCTAIVNWEGKMYPCTVIPAEDASLLEMSYAEAWEKTKETVSKMLLGMECVGCPYDKACPKCPAIRLTGLHTGHCKPEVCELTRKLVAAGVKKLDMLQESCEE